MKTSAPVSTLRYHSGASWAALIQHLGSIPKAVQYSVTRCSRRVAGWPRFPFPPTISPRMTMLGRRSSCIILRQIKYAQIMFLHHFVCSVHFPTVQKHTGIETIPHFYWKNGMGVGLQMVFSLLFLETLAASGDIRKSYGPYTHLPRLFPDLHFWPWTSNGVLSFFFKFLSIC